MKYELFYLIGASREADMEKIREDVKKTVQDTGGVFEEKETLEKRRLAYKIKHETHGIFIAQRFELPEIETIKDISQKLNLYTGVLRFVISRTEDLPEMKSKEERIKEATKRDSAEADTKERSIAKTVEKKEEQKPEAKKEETTPSNDDDIDKRLEEILNI